MAPKSLRYGTVTLPIRDDLTDRDQLFVPKWDADIEADEALERAIALGADMDIPVMMVGPTGCGKTRTLLNMACALNQPVRRVNLFGDIRSADLLGEKSLEPDATTGESVVVWRDGVIPDCKRNGYWLLLDEIDACPASIGFTIQALLEPGHPLLLTGNNGEVVEQEVSGPGIRIFATANTLGRGDDTGIYAGTNLMNEATLDRFLVEKVDYLPAAKEAEVLVKQGLSAVTAAKVIEAAALIRSGFTKAECTSTLSTRRLVAWVRIARRMTAAGAVGLPELAAAYNLSVGHKLPPEDSKFFAGVMQRVLTITVREKGAAK